MQTNQDNRVQQRVFKARECRGRASDEVLWSVVNYVTRLVTLHTLETFSTSTTLVIYSTARPPARGEPSTVTSRDLRNN